MYDDAAMPENWPDDKLAKYIDEAAATIAQLTADRARMKEELDREVHFYRRLDGIRSKRHTAHSIDVKKGNPDAQ